MSGPTEPSAPDGAAAPEAPRLPPGASNFTLEGRAAPGLYFVGWVATIMGLGVLLVGLLAGGGGSALLLAAGGAAILSLGLVSAGGSQAIERRRRADSAYLGPSPFLVFAASLPLSLLLVIVLLAPAVALGLDARSPAATMLSLLATAAVYVGLVRLLVVDPAALGWRDMGIGPPRPASLGNLAIGGLLALPVVVVAGLLAWVLAHLVGATPDSPLPPSAGTAGFILNVISAVLIAPIGEEIFFRGYATTAWARGMGPERAILRGALFFALVHVLTIGGTTFGEAAGRAIVAFVARLPMSVALGWIFLRRRSIYASIGLHATYNGLLLLLAELAARSIGV